MQYALAVAGLGDATSEWPEGCFRAIRDPWRIGGRGRGGAFGACRCWSAVVLWTMPTHQNRRMVTRRIYVPVFVSTATFEPFSKDSKSAG